MKPSAPSPRPAATPEAGHLVSAGIRAMVPGWIVEMVEDRNADALALVCALLLSDEPLSKSKVLDEAGAP